MTNVPIALGTAAILGLIFIALSVRVSIARARSKVSVGDGSQGSVMLGKEHEATPLQIACRAQANFAEYVPLTLILLFGIESTGHDHLFCLVMALLLIIARIMHPIGMERPAPNPFRAGGALLTWVVLALLSLDALFIAL